MANIQSLRILQQKDALDKISHAQEPLYVTKNGKAYLVLISPDSFDQIIQERDHYKRAFEKEKEIREIYFKIKRSRKNIEQGQCYSEEEFDKIMDSSL